MRAPWEPALLKDRGTKTFLQTIDPTVLEYCAEISSGEHGDARRAIDLLRTAAEIAGKKEEKIGKNHVDLASERLQTDRVGLMLSSASYHLKLASAALARITYLMDEPWHSTSTVYNQYRKIIRKDTKPLTYRRVSELLTELENIGLAVSQTSSKGRHGYGKQYKLTVPPEVVGKTCFPDWWKHVAEKKREHEQSQQTMKLRKSSSLFGKSILGDSLNSVQEKLWKDFVGPD